jgi:hypothetical protein
MAQLTAQQTRRSSRVRTLRVLIVAAIVILSVQGWFGDTVNIFFAPSHGITKPTATLGGFVSEVGRLSQPFFLQWHTWEGVALALLAVTVTVLALAWSRFRGVWHAACGGGPWWA